MSDDVKPLRTPVLTKVIGLFPDNPEIAGAAIRPTVTVQMECQSGQQVLLPLSDTGLHSLLKSLLQLPQAVDILIDAGMTSKPTLQ